MFLFYHPSFLFRYSLFLRFILLIKYSSRLAFFIILLNICSCCSAFFSVLLKKYSSGLAFFIILLNIYSCTSCFSQNNTADSLKALLKTALPDTHKVNLLNTLGWEYKYSNPDTSLVLLNQALVHTKKINWQKGKANTLRNIGGYHLERGNYPVALKYYSEALTIHKKLENQKGISVTLGNIGIVYYEQGDYPKALEHYFKAYEIDKALGNKSNIATWLGNIGIVYYSQGDYPKALKHYFKALEIAKELGDKIGIASNLSNIGSVYLRQGDYPKALEHYFKALEIAKEFGNKNGIAICLGSIGIVYHEQGDYSKVLEHYFKALEIAKDLGNKRGIAIILGNIGALYTTQKRYAEAEDFLNRSLSAAEEIGSMNMIKDDHQHLSKLFGELANLRKTNLYEKYENRTSADYFKLALEHYEKYLQTRDTLFNEEKSESIGKMEGRHEFALAEMERERIAKVELRITNEKIARRNKVQYAIIFMVMVVVVLIAVLFLFARFKISYKLKSGSVFITLLLLFEFILLIADTEIENITSSDPVFKLGINAVLAIVFYFIQQYLGKILPVTQKSSTNKVNRLGFCILCVLCLVQFSAFVPWWQEKEIKNNSHQNTKTPNPTKNETDEHSNIGAINVSTNQLINLSTLSKTDSLKTLLSTYQNQYNELRSTNKLKEAYETIQKYGAIKDSLQQQEKTQELNRLNEKLNLEKQQVIEKIKKEELEKIEVAHKQRIKNLKYSGILIFIILLFIFLIVFNQQSKIINHKLLSAGLFVSFLLLFEFIIVLTDPYIEQYTGGAPAWKLGFNMLLAMLIFPAHHYLEEKMRGRLFR